MFYTCCRNNSTGELDVSELIKRAQKIAHILKIENMPVAANAIGELICLIEALEQKTAKHVDPEIFEELQSKVLELANESKLRTLKVPAIYSGRPDEFVDNTRKRIAKIEPRIEVFERSLYRITELEKKVETLEATLMLMSSSTIAYRDKSHG